MCGGDLSKGTWQGYHRSRAGFSSPTAALTVEVAVLFSKVAHSTYTEGRGSHPTPLPLSQERVRTVQASDLGPLLALTFHSRSQ